MRNSNKSEKRPIEEIQTPRPRKGKLERLKPDITEFEKAEEVLSKSERFLRDVFDAIQDGISALDRDFNIIKVNPWMERLCPDKLPLVGKKCYSAYQNRDSICPWCPSLRAMETGETQTSIVPSPRVDKSIGWIELTAFPLKDTHGRMVGIIEHLKDITERKQAEEALRESEERFRQIVENTREWIWEVDVNGLYTYASPIVEKILGYKSEEIVGKKHFYDLFHPEDRKELKKGAFEVFTKKQSFRGFINRNVHKNGETVWLSTSGVPILDEKGILLGYRGADADITERKRAEEKLLEDKKQLRSLASELSLTEERERRRIAEGLHDSIIQPLVFLDIKLDSLKKSAKQRGLIDSLDEMRTTIGELIEMTRGFTFDLSSSVVYELGIEAAIEEWLTTNVREKYAIATAFEDDGQSKPLDDDMRAFLFKAVRELLVNVVKHAGASSVKVSVARDEDKIKICVEDDGAGFDSLKKKAGFFNSSGYGLFSIRERLHYLGGSFDIESKLGHGTRVALTAPLKCDS